MRGNPIIGETEERFRQYLATLAAKHGVEHRPRGCRIYGLTADGRWAPVLRYSATGDLLWAASGYTDLEGHSAQRIVRNAQESDRYLVVPDGAPLAKSRRVKAYTTGGGKYVPEHLDKREPAQLKLRRPRRPSTKSLLPQKGDYLLAEGVERDAQNRIIVTPSYQDRQHFQWNGVNRIGVVADTAGRPLFCKTESTDTPGYQHEDEEVLAGVLARTLGFNAPDCAKGATPDGKVTGIVQENLNLGPDGLRTVGLSPLESALDHGEWQGLPAKLLQPILRMIIFDLGTRNADRHQHNWLVTPKSDAIILIDHGLCHFERHTALPIPAGYFIGSGLQLQTYPDQTAIKDEALKMMSVALKNRDAIVAASVARGASESRAKDGVAVFLYNLRLVADGRYQ